MRFPKVAISLLLAAGAAAAIATPAAAYRVRAGDSLWGIAQRTGVPMHTLAFHNRIQNPDRIYAGQNLDIPGAPAATAAPAAPPAPSGSGSVTSRAGARALVVAVARERGLRPSFVLAVSMWESGLDQSRVSVDGAVGLMQIMPATAAWAGPVYLGRQADIHDARDNARLGAALLRRYLDEFNDPKLALAAYYQGAAAVHRHGIYPMSRVYVDGIWALRNRLEASA